MDRFESAWWIVIIPLIIYTLVWVVGLTIWEVVG